jgi:hypothetical protein
MRLPIVPANGKPPPLKWWGNAFYRAWAGPAGHAWLQLVIVIRLPWWRETYLPETDDIGRGQLMLSWRSREGWRHGWRAA